MLHEDTIVARSTAAGPGARGIVRLSGPEALTAARRFFETVPENASERFVETGSIFPWDTSRPVPGRLFFWPEGSGYTGRETVELHTVGSTPILDALVAGLCAVSQGEASRVRPARPGEFTMQAFLSGRLDLAQAEAVLGVIDAKDEKSLEVALNQLSGGITGSLAALRESLFDVLAHLEAGLDFADEDIEFISTEEIRNALDAALAEATRLSDRMETRRLADEKPRVVLAGPPNMGKSTLFNTLLRTDRAIVSSRSGTTRDYLEADIVLDGFPLTLVDTAGIDDRAETSTEIESRALRFAKDLADRADLLLECRDDFSFLSAPPDARILRLQTCCDRAESAATIPEDVIRVSSRTGEGIDRLRHRIADRLRQMLRGGDVVPDTALRCRDSLRRALESLNRARRSLERIRNWCGVFRCEKPATSGSDLLHAIVGYDLDGGEEIFDESILAAEIREALNHFGEIDGSVHSDDLLDRIFSRFCIGK